MYVHIYEYVCTYMLYVHKYTRVHTVIYFLFLSGACKASSITMKTKICCSLAL